MSTVLVTGGTGLLGREVAARLTAGGHTVRILTPTATTDPRTVEGDLAIGSGLDAAVEGVAAIVHCASNVRDPQRIDVAGTRRLADAARLVGDPHLVYISIVGVDRIPRAYYRAKLAAEQEVVASTLPWTILRATQFHEFAATLLERLTSLPVVPAPRCWRLQPVDVSEVAARLAAAVDNGPAGRLPDVGGPEVLPLTDLVRQYMRATGRRRPVVQIPAPGRFSAAMRAGANLAPAAPAGGLTFEQFLAKRAGAAHPSARTPS
jgi:uncharacterized protein YbjT (DUF2867 family)